MTILKWTMESVWAAVAVVITTAGGVYSWGQHSQQIADLRDKISATETHIAKHDDQLDAIKQQNAAMAQSLGDIKDTVHDIQTQVRKQPHGNHD
jgi:hypothetical protein